MPRSKYSRSDQTQATVKRLPKAKSDIKPKFHDPDKDPGLNHENLRNFYVGGARGRDKRTFDNR